MTLYDVLNSNILYPFSSCLSTKIIYKFFNLSAFFHKKAKILRYHDKSML